MSRLCTPSIVLVLAAASYAVAAPIYRLKALPDIGGSRGSYPSDINNSGQVLGISNVLPSQVGYWDADGTLHELDIPTGGLPNGMNDSGQIAGYFDPRQVYRWTPGSGTQVLGSGVATAINNSGVVVGHGDVPGPPEQIALMWNTASVESIILGALPGHNRSAALAVNSASQVAGTSFTSISNFDTPTMSRAFLWTEADGIQDLGALPGHDFSRAEAINDAGMIVGTSWNSSSITSRTAFKWTKSEGMTPLGAGGAVDVNSRGQVIGGGATGYFLWSSADGLISLASLLDSSGLGWNLTSVAAINDAGQIVAGASYGSEFHSHAVVLTPVPEPHAITLSCGAWMAVAVSSRFHSKRESWRARSLEPGWSGTHQDDSHLAKVRSK